jgi:hypothetical protein
MLQQPRLSLIYKDAKTDSGSFHSEGTETCLAAGPSSSLMDSVYCSAPWQLPDCNAHGVGTCFPSLAS